MDSTSAERNQGSRPVGCALEYGHPTASRPFTSLRQEQPQAATRREISIIKQTPGFGAPVGPGMTWNSDSRAIEAIVPQGMRLVSPPLGFRGLTSRLIPADSEPDNMHQQLVEVQNQPHQLTEDDFSQFDRTINVARILLQPEHDGRNQQLMARGTNDTLVRVNDVKVRQFVPTNLAVNGPGGHFDGTGIRDQPRIRANISPNYKGDPRNPYNLSQDELPDEENCSFWLENLPISVNTHMLLSSIRNMGRIYACVINNKECVAPWGHGRKRDAAAKVTFFTADEAQRFYDFAVRRRGLVVGNMRARVQRHRVKVGPQLGLPEHFSRVIFAIGPKEIVNREVLTDKFTGQFTWETDYLWERHDRASGVGMLQWAFGSFRCQSRSALAILLSDPVFREHGVKVWYGWDPCEFDEGRAPDTVPRDIN